MIEGYAQAGKRATPIRRAVGTTCDTQADLPADVHDNDRAPGQGFVIGCVLGALIWLLIYFVVAA
jgi:hypothetical protein